MTPVFIMWFYFTITVGNFLSKGGIYNNNLLTYKVMIGVNMVKKKKTVFICVLLLIMLFFSAWIYYVQNTKASEVGGFGGKNTGYTNVSVSDAFRNIIKSGRGEQ